MKLSQILHSQPIDGGRGSWGIFVSPVNSSFVVKLFRDEQEFIGEKIGYDKTLGEPSLKHFANQYTEIDIQLDTGVCDLRGRNPPFEKALLHPYLKDPPWKEIGKLSSTCEINEFLTDSGLDVDSVLSFYRRVGVAWYEATVFMRSDPREFKAIDLTYSKSLEEIQEDENY